MTTTLVDVARTVREGLLGAPLDELQALQRDLRPELAAGVLPRRLAQVTELSIWARTSPDVLALMILVVVRLLERAAAATDDVVTGTQPAVTVPTRRELPTGVQEHEPSQTRLAERVAAHDLQIAERLEHSRRASAASRPSPPAG